jgi:hypothetical protein
MAAIPIPEGFFLPVVSPHAGMDREEAGFTRHVPYVPLPAVRAALPQAPR